MTGLPFPSFCPFGSSFVSFLAFGPSFPLFWPFGLSFPFIVAFWAFIPFIFAFWWLASGVPPTSCQKRFVFPRSHIKNLTAPGRAPFSDFWPLALHFLLFWPCGPSFLAVWLCGPSFSFILAFWAFISFHFGLVGLHFHSFWPFRGQLLAPPPTSCQKWPVCPTSLQWIYQRRDRLHFAVFGLVGLHFLAFWPCGPSFRCILALWAFISLHFGFVGLHFLAFWPCGPSFPCILALWAFISIHFGLFGVSFWPPPPQVAKNGPFAQRPYNGFISAVTGSILQFLALWAFISFLWPFGLSFPFIVAFWAFIPFIFAFWWLASGVPPTSFWGPTHKLPKLRGRRRHRCQR